MKDNVVKDKSLEFAVRIVNLYKFLVNEQKEFVMSKQYCDPGPVLVPIFVRLSKHKVGLILLIS